MKKQNNTIILTVDDKSYSSWVTAIKNLSENWGNLYRKYYALSIGEIDKAILSEMIKSISSSNFHQQAKEYIEAELKKMYVKNGVSPLLHNHLLVGIQPKIHAFIVAFSDFKSKLDNIKHSAIGHSISNWNVLEIENLPIQGDKFNISESFLEEVKDHLFTRYLKEGTETELYNEIESLCKKLNEVNKLFREKTGMKDDVMTLINAPFFYNDDEYFEPNKYNLEYRFGYVDDFEIIPVG